MKNVLFLLISLLLASCSSDDEQKSLSNQIIGKWQVEYSKTIIPASIIDSEDEFDELKVYYPNFDFKLGLNVFSKEPMIFEYIRDENNPEKVPETGMFDRTQGDITIEFKNDYNRILIETLSLIDDEVVKQCEDKYYKQEEGLLLVESNYDLYAVVYDELKYTIRNDTLTIETYKTKFLDGRRYYGALGYCISKYSRMNK